MNYVHPVSLIHRPDIQTLDFSSLCYDPSSGLCNQLFAFVNSIIYAMLIHKKIIIFDSFCSCIENKTICPIGDIINLKKTKKRINNKFGTNLLLLDRKDLRFRIISATYGSRPIVLNVIDKIKEIERGELTKFNDGFNSIFTDPLPGYSKRLYLLLSFYNLNSSEEGRIELEIPELECNNVISFDKLNSCWIGIKSSYSWNDQYNKDIFEDLMKCLVFSDKLVNISTLICEQMTTCRKCHIVHLRIEQDIVKHWASINSISVYYTELLLNNIYKHCIANNVGIDEEIIILSSIDEDNNLLKELTKNYKLFYLSSETKNNLIREKLGYTGREIRGIIDLLISINVSQCNECYFIGTWDITYNRGSTFSYTVMQLSKFKKVTMIDGHCLQQSFNKLIDP